MSRLLPVAFVCVLLASAALTVGGMPAVSGGAVQDSSEQERDRTTSAFLTQDRFDTTEFRITVYENGSARWTISHFTPVFGAGPERSFDSDGIDPEPDAYSGQTIAESGTIRTTTTDTVTAATTEATPTSGGAGGGSQGGLLVVAFLILAVGLGASVAWRAGVFDSGSPSDESGETTAPPAATGPESGSDAETEFRTEPEAESETEPAVPDEELLSDDDRVLNMLESNGGRMKQANIVEETGWSKSKVSMLLSDMEDDEEISKLRVGRENIVSLKGHEPDAAGSPFDDDE